MRYVEAFMKRAIEISAEALTTPGTEPFGSVVVRDGRIVGEGLNRSVQNRDPTSHGETEAIQDACRTQATVDLRGCDLYTSCEPCALCVAAMEIAGLSPLYDAASMAQSGAALGTVPETARFPIDVDRLRQEYARPVDQRHVLAQQVLDRDAVAILRACADQALSKRDAL